jgi:hypothetical protein
MCITVTFSGKTKLYMDYSLPVKHCIKLQLRMSTDSLTPNKLQKISIKKSIGSLICNKQHKITITKNVCGWPNLPPWHIYIFISCWKHAHTNNGDRIHSPRDSAWNKAYDTTTHGSLKLSIHHPSPTSLWPHTCVTARLYVWPCLS